MSAESRMQYSGASGASRRTKQTTPKEQHLRILTYTSLFPNQNQPIRGIFIWQRVVHLANRRGNTCVVIAPVPYRPSWLPGEHLRSLATVPHREAAMQLTVYHSRYFLVPKISMPLHGWLMFLGAVGLATRLHREMRFDCIDAHYVYPDGFAAVLLGKLLKVPVVVSARGTDVNLFPSFRTIRPMIRWTVGEAAGIITVSQKLKDAVQDLGAPVDHIQVIPNGVDPCRFNPVERKEARRRLGLPLEAKIVVSVGALVPSKGFQFLIPAIAQIAPQQPLLKLSIVGSGPDRGFIERLVRQHRIEDRVSFVGNRPNEELKYWFSAADLSCLLSSREGQPNVVLESLACGTPVVATRVGGIPEVLTSADLGILVDQESESIRLGLTQALEKHWDRAAIARQGATRTWDTVSSEVEEFLHSRVSAFQSCRSSKATKSRSRL